MKTLLGLAALVLLPALAAAGGYGYQTYYPVYQPYYVKYPVAVYEPVKVVAYTASYVEPQQTTERVIEKTTTTTKEVIATEAVTSSGQQVQQAVTQKATKHCDGVADLAAELKVLREEVARLRGTAGPGSPGTPAPGTQPSLLQAKCAACHSPDTANGKGGGFVLLEKDGALATLSLPDKSRVVRRVGNGQMPPPGNKEGIAPLTEEEKKAVLNHFAK